MLSLIERRGLVFFKRTLSSFPANMSEQEKAFMTKDRKVILKHLNGEDRFSLSFSVDNSSLNVNRQFNMSRNLDEDLAPFVERLNANLEKALSKNKRKKKKKEEKSDGDGSGSSGLEPDVTKLEFVKNGIVIEPELTTKVKDFLFQPDLSLRIYEEDFSIDINPPIAEGLKLPDSIMSGFAVYPFKFSLFFADKEDSIFEWWVSKDAYDEKKSKDNIQWVMRSTGFFFTPAAEDVNHWLKLVCTPCNGDRVGLPAEVISKKAISAGPGYCPFEDRHQFTPTFLEGPELRVLTYNLLADLYADSEFSRNTLHPQCPPYALDIDYRKQLILKEVIGFHADIMCMQEVDFKIFEGDLKPVLGSHGYDGQHMMKGGKVSEGGACFWRQDRFRMLQHDRLVVAQALESDERFRDIKECVERNSVLKEDLYRRTTALQTVVLEDVTSSGKKGFVVGNTHLYFRPDADHIRLIQIAVCVRELQAALEAAKAKWPSLDFSILLFGDFNSTPPFGVLQFMRSGLIPPEHPDWSSCPDQEVRGLTISHPFSFESACGTPEFTTYTIGFKDCLDYIFYQPNKLEVTSVVPFPLTEELEKQIGIPNVTFPSDHISCVADLRWRS